MSGNSVRSNLLKYRYVKGNFSKLAPVSSSSSSQDGTESSQDSSTSETSRTSASNSSPELSSQNESSQASSTSSPWMSKNRGRELNGTVGKKKKRRLLICGRLSASDSEDEGLRLGNKCAGKRPAEEDGDSDPVVLPSVKRARLLLSSQSQELGSQAELPPSPSKAGPPPSPDQSDSTERKISFLQDAFPNHSKEVLAAALTKAGGCCERAALSLTEEEGPSTNGHGPASAAMATASGLHSRSVLPQKTAKVKDYESDLDEDEAFDADGTDVDSEDSLEGEQSGTAATMILTFFEDATLEELVAIPGGSKKKAELIIQLRPFSTWNNLVAKFEERRTLSYSLISGCREMIHMRHIVKNLMKKCEKISEEMSNIITSLMDDSNDSEDRITCQPSILNHKMQLAQYQLVGLNWLRIMHSQELDGILADEMGLGKTIQTIAFLAHLYEQNEKGPHVIIVPPSTIDNWLRELDLWCPSLRVEVYFGSQEERRHVRHLILHQGHKFNILLTTYNMATGSLEDRALFKKFQFQYAVFDEGHLLKNIKTLRFQHLMKIRAERRLLLTGTPLQNNLTELMSLLCFVMPQIFQGKTEPLKRVMSSTKGGEEGQGSYEAERIAQAKRIMRPFVLRRVKSEALSHLPKKEESVELCPLLAGQQEMYDQLVCQFHSELESPTGVGNNGGSSMFMQLRKVANHPLLLRTHYTPEKTTAMAKALVKEPSYKARGALQELIVEDLQQFHDYEIHQLCQLHKDYIGKYALDSTAILESSKIRRLDELLQNFKKKGNRVLLFSQFTMVLDIIQEYMTIRGHRFVRLDGTTSVADRQPLIDKFTSDEGIFVFLLSTRAGGMGINLTAADVVIIHDIDFNPYNDKQAEDRCHRVGQKKKVQVIRLVSKDTVEEIMLGRAQYKLKLERDITGTHEDNDEDKSTDVVSLLKEALAAKTRSSRSSDAKGVALPSAMEKS